MITIHETRTINLPLTETWEYVANFATAEEWDPGVKSASLEAGDGGVGTTYDVTATFAGSEVPLVYEVTEYETEKRIVLEASSTRFSAVDTIGFSSAGDSQTTVDYRAVFELQAPLKYVALFMKPLFNRLGTKAMDGMKSTLG